jgi:dihydrodipicolinate synthase/N-acetylneuraminate lyase
MLTDEPIFRGCIPALMTPCGADGSPNFDALVAKGCEVIATGMRAVVYCGSMGDWPLLTDEQRREGVRQLVAAGVPVIVGTGAQNPKLAAAHAAHAQQVAAAGLMVIPVCFCAEPRLQRSVHTSLAFSPQVRICRL